MKPLSPEEFEKYIAEKLGKDNFAKLCDYAFELVSLEAKHYLKDARGVIFVEAAKLRRAEVMKDTYNKIQNGLLLPNRPIRVPNHDEMMLALARGYGHEGKAYQHNLITYPEKNTAERVESTVRNRLGMPNFKELELFAFEYGRKEAVDVWALEQKGRYFEQTCVSRRRKVIRDIFESVGKKSFADKKLIVSYKHIDDMLAEEYENSRIVRIRICGDRLCYQAIAKKE